MCFCRFNGEVGVHSVVWLFVYNAYLQTDVRLWRIYTRYYRVRLWRIYTRYYRVRLWRIYTRYYRVRLWRIYTRYYRVRLWRIYTRYYRVRLWRIHNRYYRVRLRYCLVELRKKSSRNQDFPGRGGRAQFLGT